ncbi:MAG: hypothetical protein ACREH8_15550 [Opitutaceae bacterium]
MLVLIFNVAVACGVAIALVRQLPKNQLAAGYIDGARSGVYIGHGWFERESYAKDVWVWSKGDSALLLRTSSTQPKRATLRFSIRASASER